MLLLMESLVLVALTILALSIAIAACSITLTRARITEPLRKWLQPRSFLLYKLASCPYCMSHWLAAGLTPFFLLGLTSHVVLNFFLTMFLLVGLSALFEGLMMNWLHMTESMINDLGEDNNQLLDENQVLRDKIDELATLLQAERERPEDRLV